MNVRISNVDPEALREFKQACNKMGISKDECFNIAIKLWIDAQKSKR